ncbi:BTB/POZ domain-containing protein At3g19850 isoform X2 [Tripterygium wilfordii]|uniref:BTB/POZ domain-containing protein At3g19850 isoform X2 n=1 Tax=Tripterygium wilfordii TaxID=458696 RepID=UPI0018F7EF2E|nr:BTB/POZ domain-containing protein At3g19850 isoform X2 [Tripterygium wilfordii]
MLHLYDGGLYIHVNGQQTFFLSEIVSAYSRKLRKIIKNQKRRTLIKNSTIEIHGFPGGPDGFELVCRFCYNNGKIPITVSNVSLLHCCAVFLGMTEKVASFNLLQQTETFFEGMFYWSWSDLIVSLKNCESFYAYADSIGLTEKLICALLENIAQNSDTNLIPSSSSSSSSPETPSGFRFSSSTRTTPESIKPFSSTKQWWFEDLTIFAPLIIEKVIKILGSYGSDNNSLVLTRFILYYMKSRGQSKDALNSRSAYSGLADTAVYGVISMAESAFSCRGLLWVLRFVSNFGLSNNCRDGLERLIGGLLEQTTLDDLLVSARHEHRCVYDVNLVLRLIKVFVHSERVSAQKIKKVGALVDMYLREIAPDHNLKMSKFLGVAESLPDCARDSFDGVYRAIDIYLESHPTLSFDERSRLFQCLNYEKLSLEACKDLAKNPRIPANVSIQALKSQKPKFQEQEFGSGSPSKSTDSQMVMTHKDVDESRSFSQEMMISEDVELNMQRMQWRMEELEKVCRDMKGQMSRFVRDNVMEPPPSNRALPRLC